MSTKRWIFVLVVVIVVATAVNAAIFAWQFKHLASQRPVPFAQLPVSPPVRPPARPVTPPVAEPQPIAGPVAGPGVRQSWWPAPLTAEQIARRAASDAFLMRSRRLDDKVMENDQVLQRALIGQHYDEVEQKLNDMLAMSVADPAYDFVERDLSSFVDGSSSTTFLPRVEGSVIDAWVKARPKSAWAHYSAGQRWMDQAWDARGEHSASEVSDEHWAMMHRFAKKARVELKKALALNPRMFMAWVTLMDADRMDAQLGGSVWQDYIEGSKYRPYTFMLPDQIEVASEPRWGGTYSVMDAVARKTIAKIDHNPRFWELLGFAASDRGYGAVDEHCTPCSVQDWTTALREYNAALAYADRATWLAGAARAALHLKRYAVAYRYFERAYAYEPQNISWKSEMSVLRALCDPNWSREKFESLRQESVQYGLVYDRDYPRASGDCQYHQAELPWGSEPLPDKVSVLAYNLDADSNPSFQAEPRPVRFPGSARKLPSPDGALTVIEADTPGSVLHQLMLQDATGKTTHLYTYSLSADVVFNSTGKRLIVQDDGADRMTCFVFDLAQGSHVDLSAEFKRQVLSKDPSLVGFTPRLRCSFFWNDDLLTFGMNGFNQGTKASIFRMYRYDASSGAITIDPQFAGSSTAPVH